MECWNNGKLGNLLHAFQYSINPLFHIHPDNKTDKVMKYTKCYIITNEILSYETAKIKNILEQFI